MASERDEVERELERRRKLRQKRQEERVRQEKQRRALMIRLGAGQSPCP